MAAAMQHPCKDGSLASSCINQGGTRYGGGVPHAIGVAERGFRAYPPIRRPCAGLEQSANAANALHVTYGSGPLAALSGSESVATAPPAGAFFSVTRPWCSSAISFTNERPRPVLFFAVAGRASE